MNTRALRPAVAAIPRPAQWLPLDAGCAKFNVDAAVSRRGRFGAVGAICRDLGGAFMGASVLVFRYIVEPQTLEALAIREALALSGDLYLRGIHMASDCKVVVDDIKKENSSSYGATIHEILEQSSCGAWATENRCGYGVTLGSVDPPHTADRGAGGMPYASRQRATGWEWPLDPGASTAAFPPNRCCLYLHD